MLMQGTVSIFFCDVSLFFNHVLYTAQWFWGTFSAQEIYLNIQVRQRLMDEWMQTCPLQEKHQAIIKTTP